MIIRFLTIPEIQKMYKGKKINKNHRGEATEGKDYIVISIGMGLYSEKNKEEIMRYWIVNDEEGLLPYDSFNFKIIDSYLPKSWIMNLYDTRVEFSHPKWAKYGYTEDYFDDIKVEKEYNKIVKEIFYESIEAAKKNCWFLYYYCRFYI